MYTFTKRQSELLMDDYEIPAGCCRHCFDIIIIVIIIVIIIIPDV